MACEGHHPAWPAGATIDRWKTEAGLGGQRAISFRQFLRFLADEQAQGRAIDSHFGPQFEPLQDMRVHEVCRADYDAYGAVYPTTREMQATRRAA